MPKRSAVTQLPDDVKEDLNRKLIKNGFADYQGLADWLTEQGFGISKSSIHRYGQEFESRLSAIQVATEQAKAIASAAGDEEGAMNDALIRLVQERAFDVLINLQSDNPDEFAKIFPKMGVMVARLSRASVAQKKWQAEARKKAREAARKVSKVLKNRGLSEDAADAIRKDILGIAG
jgi:phosphohistidine phosphatase SixA